MSFLPTLDQWSTAIMHAIHPESLGDSVQLLMNPFDSTVNWKFVVQTRTIQGVFFSLSLLVALVYTGFLMNRMLYNGCGGRRPSKFGYSSFTLNLTRSLYLGLAVISLFVAILSMVTNGFLGTSGKTTLDLFDSTLIPLTEGQIAHQALVQQQNAALFEEIRSENVSLSLSAQWNATVGDKILPAFSQYNISLPAEQSQILFASIVETLNGMRSSRIAVYQVLNVQLPPLMKSLNESLRFSADLAKLSAEIEKQFNLTQADNLLKTFNQTISSKVPSEHQSDALQFLGSSLTSSLSNSSLFAQFTQTLKAFPQQPQSQLLFDSLRVGVDRCDEAVLLKKTVPSGGKSMRKFSQLMEMLRPVVYVIVPIVFALSSLASLGLIGGAVGWFTNFHRLLFWLSLLFAVVMVGGWMIDGIVLPVAIVTDGACANRDFFKANSVEFTTGKNPYVSQASQDLPTCAFCEKQSITGDWSTFSRQWQNLSSLALSTAASGNATAVWSPVPALQAVIDESKAFEAVQPNDILPLIARDNGQGFTSAAQKTKVYKENSDFSALIDQLIAQSLSFSQGFQYLRGNLTLLAPQLQEIIQSVDALTASVEKYASDASTTLQNSLEQYASRYQQATTADFQCDLNSAKNTTISEDTYINFELKLCGSTLPAMNVLWLSELVLVILLIPVSVLVVRGYKIVGFSDLLSAERTHF